MRSQKRGLEELLSLQCLRRRRFVRAACLSRSLFFLCHRFLLSTSSTPLPSCPLLPLRGRTPLLHFMISMHVMKTWTKPGGKKHPPLQPVTNVQPTTTATPQGCSFLDLFELLASWKKVLPPVLLLLPALPLLRRFVRKKKKKSRFCCVRTRAFHNCVTPAGKR